MFRRIRRLNAGGLSILQLQKLNQANQYLTSGNYQQAAPIFTSLAKELQAENHPRRAANCFAQAAHAYADNLDPDQAVIQAKNALDLFLQNQMLERAPRFYTNMTTKLKQHGMSQAALSLEQAYAQRIQGASRPASGASGAAPTATQVHGRLPSACPKCGAPINGNDISWLDAYSAECDYCGTIVQVLTKS